MKPISSLGVRSPCLATRQSNAGSILRHYSQCALHYYCCCYCTRGILCATSVFLPSQCARTTVPRHTRRASPRPRFAALLLKPRWFQIAKNPPNIRLLDVISRIFPKLVSTNSLDFRFRSLHALFHIQNSSKEQA